MMNRLVSLMTLAFLPFGGCLGGCSMMEGLSFAKSGAVIAQTMSDKIGADGVLKDWLTDLRAQGINPSIVIESGPVWRTRIGFDGVSGQFIGTASGVGTYMTPGMNEVILQMATTGSDTQRAQALQILEWNRRMEEAAQKAAAGVPLPTPGQ